MNDPTQSVGPITYRGRSENDLYTFNHIGVNGNGILKVSTSINSVVHPYSIYYQKQSIGFKPSQYRTSPSSLGFLNADSRTEAYQISTGCGSLGRMSLELMMLTFSAICFRVVAFRATERTISSRV